MGNGLTTPGYRNTAASVAAAVTALRTGGLAIFPTETVYGVGAHAGSPAAVARFRTLLAGADRPPTTASTWHAASPDRVVAALKISNRLHRRVFDKLTPGPVRLLVQVPADDLAAILAGLGVGPGVIEHKGEFSIRIPDHPLAQAILSEVPGVVIADRASAAGIGDGRELPEDAAARAAALGIAAVVDDGPARLGKPSTVIRLNTSGGFEVLPGGQFDDRYIRRKVERVVVFVCTGNTCRSPMAEAIARQVLAQGGDEIPTRVMSAGVAAGNGQPMTAEAREALSELDIDAGAHRSRSLTLDMVRDADAVYTMTRAHRDAVLEVAPDLESRIHLLDPDGRDVKDPIGLPLDEYRSTARALREVIQRRLAQPD